jgi:hypothetical protein
MARVDVVVCSHPAANCELFMPLNRTLVVYPTTRLEFGRCDDNIDWRQPYYDTQRSPQRWSEWIDNLQRIMRCADPSPVTASALKASQRSRNVLAANSLYEVMYIKYFTGLDAYYLPSWCGDASGAVVSYAPTRRAVLLGPTRDNLDAGACKAWVRA